jgi:immune inhibitor A
MQVLARFCPLPADEREMTPNRRKFVWIGLALIAGCCLLAACGLASFAWVFGLRPVLEPAVEVLPTVQGVPTPVAREPATPERETLLALRQVTLPERDVLELSERLGGQSIRLPEATPAPAPYRVGDRQTFWVHDTSTTSFLRATAVLRYETEHAYWWVEEGYVVDELSLERSARAFEENTYPTNHRLFGSEWSPGIDGDPHVYIFLGNVPGVAGLFSGPDEYPAAVRQRSNEHEMFYISLDNAHPGNAYFDGVLAHEHQHMIHWAIDRNEDSWVNEGLSELAAHLAGYDPGGTELPFLAMPDTQLTTWPDLEDSSANYGASYLFLLYFYEQYGAGAIRRLVADPADGMAGFEAVLAEVDPSRSPDDLLADWLVANYMDEIERAEEEHRYESLSLDQIALSARHRNYPLDQRGAVEQYAADYIVLEGQGDLTLEFEGSRLVSLLGNSTHSGSYQWWALRGDEGNATLTRNFDLTSLEAVTLQAWAWYDLEVDYDYAYVSVSADGGETWSLLANDHTTTRDPSDSSFGPALTGISGGGTAAEWVLQSFDLTPFAGRPVLIRFEVVTDDNVSHAGLALDDIAIPELGYADDVEGGDGGWQAAGWLRVTDQIPQEFLVQVILLGNDVRVERMVLDDEMKGTLQVSGLGSEVEEAVLVVSALAPMTTEPAIYRYRASLDE